MQIVAVCECILKFKFKATVAATPADCVALEFLLLLLCLL